MKTFWPTFSNPVNSEFSRDFSGEKSTTWSIFNGDFSGLCQCGQFILSETRYENIYAGAWAGPWETPNNVPYIPLKNRLEQLDIVSFKIWVSGLEIFDNEIEPKAKKNVYFALFLFWQIKLSLIKTFDLIIRDCCFAVEIRVNSLTSKNKNKLMES